MLKVCFVEQAGETFPVSNSFSKECHFDVIFLNVTTHKNLFGTSCNYHIFILHFHCHFSLSPVQKHLLFISCTQYYFCFLSGWPGLWLWKLLLARKKPQNYEYPEVSTYHGKSKHFTKEPHDNHCYAWISSWKSVGFMIFAFCKHLLKQSLIQKHF